jgi:hypothetical protein
MVVCCDGRRRQCSQLVSRFHLRVRFFEHGCGLDSFEAFSESDQYNEDCYENCDDY